MNPDSPDPQLSDLGRAMLGSAAARPGSKPSAAWVPPTAEELQIELPQYEIAKMLGRGGMGAVYMGRQTSLDRAVAIKILSGALEESDAGFSERFKNEARAMAKLNHPGIVSVYDFGQTASGLLYIVMEYVDGTDVAKMIVASGRLHSEHAMAITAHVCDALSYAHERGIIHRDIKPANIMVAYDGSVKVADFGLAKVSTANGSTMGLTQSGMALGTLHYMAPEALILGTAVDHRADIYAVGVMLYQMLTGKLPQGMFKMPSQIVPGIDPRYDGVIAKAIMEDRDERYPGVRDLRGALDTIVTQPVAKVDESAKPALPTQARPQRPGARPPQPAKSSPPAAQPSQKSFPFGLAAMLLLILAGAAWFFFFKPQEPKASNVTAEPAPSVTTAPTATPKTLAQIRVLTPDAVRVLKLEKGQPRLYDSNPLRVIEGVAAGLEGWQFTSIPQRIDNEYTIRVEKPGVIYAFGAFHKGTTPQDSLGSDAARWVNAEGDITGAMVKFCYKRNVSAGETLKFKAFELQFAAPSMTLEITPASTAVPAGTSTSASPGNSATAAAPEGWISLFNGKDLTGWELHPADFPAEVVKGAIRIQGVTSIPVSGNMYYRGTGAFPQWTDFEVMCTVMTEQRGNSGLYVHARPGLAVAARADGVEVQILNDPKFRANANNAGAETGGLQRLMSAGTYYEDGEWIQIKTRVEGKRVQTWMKRPSESEWKPGADWTQPENWLPPGDRPGIKLGSGTLSFQNNPPQDGFVWVKEIFFRELKSTSAQPDMSASSASSVASATLWIDTKGRSLQAKFVNLQGSNVLLDIAGKVTPVPLTTLSTASQEIARQLVSASPAPAPAVPSGTAWLEGRWLQADDPDSGAHYITDYLPGQIVMFKGGNVDGIGQWTLRGTTITNQWPRGHFDTTSFTSDVGGRAMTATLTLRNQTPKQITLTKLADAVPVATFSEKDIEGRLFDFGWISKADPSASKLYLSTMRTQPKGHFDVVKNANESSWDVRGGKLLFKDAHDKVTTTFDRCYKMDGHWLFVGDFHANSGIHHIFREQFEIPSPSAQTDSGWSSLFPSDSLSGWTGDTSAYRVSGGVLTGSGRGDLISPKEYSNFELKFDLRISDEANSGIGIWRDAVTGTTATASHGFEVQIQDDTAPKYSKQEFWQRHGGIYFFKPPLSLAMNPTGSWNTHEIRVEGTQVKVTINGRLVQDADVSQLKPQISRAPVLDVSRRRGHLMIMGRVGTAEFRNLQIKELP